MSLNMINFPWPLSSSKSILAFLSVATILLSFLLLPLLLPSVYMLNYRNLDVKSLDANKYKALETALLGLKYTEGEAKRPNEISKSQLPNNLRVVGPGMIYTMEFDDQRLTLHVDKENQIKKIQIG